MDEGDLTRLQLDVYMTREGPWNPDHGDIEIPESWDFLPSGDAFVTRRVKAAGTFWVAWRPRGRKDRGPRRRHRAQDSRLEKRQLEERLRAGESWVGEDWVFTDQLGRPVNPEWVGKRFRKLIEGTELPSITMRQLRHSHATTLLRAGVHPKVVQERLGHSSIAVTLDTYSSVLPTIQREAVERLAGLIESS